MNEWYILILVLTAGILLGILFFGGLWVTVKYGLVSRQPALWFAVSLLLRLATTLTVFYLIAGTCWERFITMLSGFIIGRILVKQLTRNDTPKQIQSKS